MKRCQGFLYGLHPYLLRSIAGALTVAQIVLVFFVRRPRSEALEWIGWICLWISCIFGWGVWPKTVGASMLKQLDPAQGALVWIEW
mgnify:CR=1 FL=1